MTEFLVYFPDDGDYHDYGYDDDDWHNTAGNLMRHLIIYDCAFRAWYTPVYTILRRLWMNVFVKVIASIVKGS